MSQTLWSAEHSLSHQWYLNTHLSFLLVEIVNNDTNEKIEGEEGAKNDEHDKVNVHVKVDFFDRLLFHLKKKTQVSPLP